jgi:hypothetical protein
MARQPLPPTRIITYAWGEKYVDFLLSLSLPAILAPGNLPYVASAVPCEFVILTQERFFPTVGASAPAAEIRRLCPLRLIGLDDLVTAPDKYGMTLTYALHRGFAELGEDVTGHWLIFLNADFILADGSWRNLLRHLAGGARLVAAPSYCVQADEVVEALHKRVDCDTSVLSIPPREMANMVLRHRHNTIRGKTVNEREFGIRYMDQFYWKVDEQTLIGHQMPVSIVGMRPERQVSEPQAFWDHGLMREFCPTADIRMIGDSDEFLMMELREKQVAADQLLKEWPSARAMGEIMVTWVTPYQREFADRPLTLHASDVPSQVTAARKELQYFVEDVLSYAPADLPSHVDHPQWRYHLPAFMEARHRYLSERLGSATETRPPSEELSPLDRVWWRLDGLQKAHRRTCEEITARADVRRGLIRTELARREAAFAERRNVIAERRLRALTASAPDGGEAERVPKFFEEVLLGRGLALREYPGTWAARVSAHDEEQRELEAETEHLTRHRQATETALQDIDEEERQRLQSLESDFESARVPLHMEYERLVGRRAEPVESPPQAPDLEPGPAPTMSGLRKAMYHRLFGHIPRVRPLHPFWAATRQLVRIVDAEAARGGANVLMLMSPGGVIASVADDFPGRHVQISRSDLTLPDLGVAFEAPFDLGICELAVAELADVGEIFAVLKPFMRPGGRLIAFHLNVSMETVPADRLFEIGLAGWEDRAHVHYAGSSASVRAARDFGAAVARCQTGRYGSLARGALALLSVIPRTLLANRAEAAMPQNGRPLQSGPWMSVTVEVTV